MLLVCLFIAYSAHIPILYFATGIGMVGLSFIGLCVYEFYAARSLYHHAELLENSERKASSIAESRIASVSGFQDLSIVEEVDAYNELTL